MDATMRRSEDERGEPDACGHALLVHTSRGGGRLASKVTTWIEVSHFFVETCDMAAKRNIAHPISERLAT